MGGAELRQGQYGFFVLLHEMGHALGLKHSFESPALPAAEDNMDHSILSYTDGTYAKRGFGLAPATPAPDDIAALQFLYGANMSTNAGDNRYTIKAGDPLHTIWDAGGHDIIDTTSYNAGAVIDLQEGGDHPIHLGSTAVWLAYNSHIEDAVAGAGNDTIIGNTLNNVLTGNAGNDSIVGGGGSDQIFGNDGNDTIGAGGNSLIDGGNGIDAISYQSASGVVVNLQDILGTGVDSLGDTIRSIEAGIFGSPGNDSINGNAAANYLTGGDGGDLIQGFAGNDSLNGNAGNDSIAGGDGLDVIFGGQGDDSLNGNAGADTLSGDKGNDTIFGGKGGDSIAAGDGDDYLNGNLGNDTLSGDAGNDTLIGEDGDDSLSGGADNDVLVGGIGNDTLFGGVGNDTIYGGPGANVIDAGAGNDMIVTGGVGEILTGGNGNDTFAIFGVGGAIINDFVTSQDHIEFHDIFLNTKAAIAATSFDGTNATIFLPGGEVITLLHVPVRLVAEDISIINTA